MYVDRSIFCTGSPWTPRLGSVREGLTQTTPCLSLTQGLFGSGFRRAEDPGGPSWRACAFYLANASIAGSLSHLSVALLRPCWSINFAALGTSILCLRSRMTSTRDTCSSDSFSPRNPQSIDTWCTPSTSSRASDLLCGAYTPSPITQNLHHDRYGRCVVMCSWCSLTVGWPGSRTFLSPARTAVIEPHLSVLHVLVVFFHRSAQHPFSSLRRTQHTVAFLSSSRSAHPVCGLTVSARLDLSSTLHSLLPS